VILILIVKSNNIGSHIRIETMINVHIEHIKYGEKKMLVTCEIKDPLF